MWKSFMSSEIAKSVQESLEKTGDTITKQAQLLAKTTPASKSPHETQNHEHGETEQQEQLTDRLKKGWGSMLVATKQVVQEARVVVEKEQHRIAARLSDPDRPRRRDPSLPLDVEALQDAEVVYITDRIMTLSHPAMQSTVDGDITPARKLAAVAHLLHKRHGGRFMIWNLSEVEYDLSIMDDQVLLFSFPGSPSPPLGLLLKLLISMESWLKADERNVAVVHCLTGKGRTSTVVAAFLCWMGEAGFRDVNQALDYIAKCKRCSTEDLTIPSQRRYVQYFANMLDGVRPSQPPLVLKRIILSEAPRFAKGPPRDNMPPPPDDAGDDYNPDYLLMGCAPYLQIFKAGQLVFTTAATLHYNQTKEELPFCQIADGPISFHIENVVQGDILIRCRHLTVQGQRVSMFRAAFHTGYVPPNVMRLTKDQLDGACTDKRFSDDFFMDLIFEPCGAEMASKHLSGKADAVASAAESMNDVESQNEASQRRERGTMAGAAILASQAQPSENQGATVTASAYDSMLHRDSRFWDVIAARRQDHAQLSQEERDSEALLVGPTVGRRRNFEKKTEHIEPGATGSEGASAALTITLPTFSIGGDFDFLQSLEPAHEEKEPAPKAKPKERDELMDALNAIDDDDSPIAARKQRTMPTEEILFDVPAENYDDMQRTKLFKEDISPANETCANSSERTLTEAVSNAEEPSESKTVDEATAILADADLQIDDDVDAFLALNETTKDDDPDVDDFDFEDDDLEDLESFLTSK